MLNSRLNVLGKTKTILGLSPSNTCIDIVGEKIVKPLCWFYLPHRRLLRVRKHRRFSHLLSYTTTLVILVLIVFHFNLRSVAFSFCFLLYCDLVSFRVSSDLNLKPNLFPFFDLGFDLELKDVQRNRVTDRKRIRN